MGGVGEGLWLEKGTWRHFGHCAAEHAAGLPYFVVCTDYDPGHVSIEIPIRYWLHVVVSPKAQMARNM